MSEHLFQGRRTRGWAGACALAALAPLAGHADEAATAETITITATRSEQPSFAVPASVDVIGGEAFNEDRLGVNLSDGLSGVPGVLARDRQNYAQDTQISIRGFGSRATFGIRGLRLYLDGIPATQPDGAGQVSHFNLASADRVEILRGPFSTLYGNSSGGVISLFTADGATPPRLTAGAAGGSFGSWRANLGASGRAGISDYTVDYTHFETDGFRDHSQAERESFNGKLNLAVGEHGRLSLLLNHFDAPDAQDPLGLSRQQFDDDPSQATGVAETFNTRKSTRQSQGGAIYEHALGAHSLRVLAYAGNREVLQFLSIPVASQDVAVRESNITSSGGVVDLDSDYAGTDLRWRWRGRINQRPLTVVAGLNYDALSQDRRGYENYVSTGEAQQLGVRGALRRDERNDIDNFDQYLQASLELSAKWSSSLGLRRSEVRFESSDRYVNGANGDDSGRADFEQTTPAVGLSYRATPDLNLYGAFARGFETPTFVELAYRPDGESGLNFDLEPARSSNSELGAKWRLGARTRVNAALFHTRTQDEIVVATNAGGRSTFQNAGRTQRQGLELLLEQRALDRLRLQLAWTYLDARVREDYLACTGTPCFVPETAVARGNRVAGVPESSLFGALQWGGEAGLQAGLELRYLDAVPVNDVNSESAPSYTLVGADLGYVFVGSWGRLRAFVRGDNLFDEDYVGSVIVNDGNGRYYEPGAERSVLAGVKLDWNY